MKKLIPLIVFVIFFTAEICPQTDYTGIWQGTLKINTVELRLVFRISQEGDTLKALLDSPDQGAKDIPVSSVITTDSSIRLNVDIIKGYYEGVYRIDSSFIDGRWFQGGLNLPLVLKKIDKVEEVKRPQNPVPPFPYSEEEVVFENKEAGIKLAGTLTIPKEGKNFPAVILISGSGRQDRDESLLGHKPFLVLADHFSRNGIAVLRYDDRGGGKSTGNFAEATSMDFTTDAIAAVNYLKSRKEINHDQIGLAGHSEGGIIAPMAANRNKDIAYIVLMAGTGIPGDKLLLLQGELISRAEGEKEEEIIKGTASSQKIYDLIKTENDTAVLRHKISEILMESYSGMTEEQKKNSPDPEVMVNQQVSQLMSPWFRYFVKHDPYTELKKVKIPVLAINGEFDLQVPPKQNLSAIEKALEEAGNDNFKIVEMPGLNHLFQTTKTGKVSEYNQIEETFSPAAMKIITDWIHEVTAVKK